MRGAAASLFVVAPVVMKRCCSSEPIDFLGLPSHILLPAAGFLRDERACARGPVTQRSIFGFGSPNAHPAKRVAVKQRTVAIPNRGCMEVASLIHMLPDRPLVL
jgi:hypothetical protein